jgi:hypothetical protein
MAGGKIPLMPIKSKLPSDFRFAAIIAKLSRVLGSASTFPLVGLCEQTKLSLLGT